ncbi:MAG: M28 family peptidase [Candidatus Lokiarchaeota archaeon]|nr:M28 family peptidase [Candidatus Lokiarchaeota archaeon]
MTYNFNAEKMTKIIKDLSHFRRYVGEEDEVKAIRYCKDLYDEIDVDLKEEPFECVRGWVGWIQQAIFAFVSGMIGLMIYLLLTHPWMNLIIILVLVGIAGAITPGLMGTGGLKMIGNKYTSKNLIGTIPPKNEAKPKQYIIISGHHDSKSQVFSTVFRALSYILMAIGAVFLLLSTLIASILDIIGSTPRWLQIFGLVFAIISLCGTIPLSLNFTGNKSPGALDNASSIAVIYEVARFIKEQGGLENTELVVAIFGAEEVAMWGARAFCKAHKEDYPPEDAVNINIDMVGYKDAPVEIMQHYGLPVKKPVSEFMSALAFKVAEEQNVKLKGYWMPMGASTDGFVLRDNGYDGCEFNVIEAAMNTHQSTDDINKWDASMGVDNCRVIMGMIDKLSVHGIHQK